MLLEEPCPGRPNGKVVLPWVEMFCHVTRKDLK